MVVEGREILDQGRRSASATGLEELDDRLDGAVAVVVDDDGVEAVGETFFGLGLVEAVLQRGGVGGRVTIEEGGITPSEGSSQHATGKVHGGGPALTLRATGGSITVRKPAGK